MLSAHGRSSGTSRGGQPLSGTLGVALDREGARVIGEPRYALHLLGLGGVVLLDAVSRTRSKNPMASAMIGALQKMGEHDENHEENRDVLEGSPAESVHKGRTTAYALQFRQAPARHTTMPTDGHMTAVPAHECRVENDATTATE